VSNLAVRERAAGRTDAAPTLVGRGHWWLPVVAFVGVGLVLWLVVGFSAAHFSRQVLYPVPGSFRGGPFFEGWVRWDAYWYRTIVREGYDYYPNVQSSIAFWPSYPIAVRGVSGLFPSIFISAVLVTVAAGFTSAVLFYRWCLRFLSPRAAATALAVLLVYPYSWYLFGAVYADALLLTATLAAFLFLERDRLWLAGLAGMVATAAKPTGIVVGIGLVAVLIEHRNRAAGTIDRPLPEARRARFGASLWHRFDPRVLRRSDAPIALAFAGFAGYCAFLGLRFGDPLLWSKIEGVKGWDQPPGPQTWLKFNFFKIESEHFTSAFANSVLLCALLALGAYFLLPRIARRFGWGYAVFSLLAITMPVLGTKDFLGVGRYLLVAFPMFAAFGDLLSEHRAVRRVVLVASAAALVAFTSLYARGFYLA